MNERIFFDTDWYISHFTLKYVKRQVNCRACPALYMTQRKANENMPLRKEQKIAILGRYYMRNCSSLKRLLQAEIFMVHKLKVGHSSKIDFASLHK